MRSKAASLECSPVLLTGNVVARADEAEGVGYSAGFSEVLHGLGPLHGQVGHEHNFLAAAPQEARARHLLPPFFALGRSVLGTSSYPWEAKRFDPCRSPHLVNPARSTPL